MHEDVPIRMAATVMLVRDDEVSKDIEVFIHRIAYQNRDIQVTQTFFEFFVSNLTCGANPFP